MTKVIGIDLGTTNSVAAHVKNGRAEVLTTTMNEEHTPSVVCCRSKEGQGAPEYIVGTAAVRIAKMFPTTTVRSVKRLMGRSFNDKRVRETQQRMPYRIVEADSSDNDSGAYIDFGHERLSPVSVSAKILAQIKKDAEKALGESVQYAVITVPAYFEEKQRVATKEAGEAAGFTVLQIIDEPTAAALAYGADAAKDQGRRILVFDLGGGTFDVSLIKVLDDQYVVDRIKGNNWLGGDDFDHEIAKIILNHLKEKGVADPDELQKDATFVTELKRVSEEAKKLLSVSETADVQDVCRRGEGEPISLDLTVKRAQFDRAIKPYVKQCAKLLDEVLATSGTEAGSIDDVILVGGSTSIPAVYEAVSKLFGEDKIRRTLNPMHCVAQGAARLAEDLSRTLGDAGSPAGGPAIKMSQSTAMDFGIQVKDGENSHAFAVIIKAGTPYPLTQPIFRRFSTVDHNQKVVRVAVFEGMGKNVTDFEVSMQGELVINVEEEFGKKEGLPLNHPIDVGFDYDVNRTLTVLVNVEGTGKTLQRTIEHRDLHIQGLNFEDEEELGDNADDIFDTAEEQEHTDDDIRAFLSRELKNLQFFLDRRSRMLREDQIDQIKDHIRRGRELLLQQPFNRGLAEVIIDFIHEDVNNSGAASMIEAVDNICNAPINPQTRVRLLQAKEALLQTFREHGDRSEEYARVLENIGYKLQEARQELNIEGVKTTADSGGALKEADN